MAQIKKINNDGNTYMNQNMILSIVTLAAKEIKGVVITAKGVNNTTNKLKVLHAVEAVIDVNNGNVEILSSE